ncbi:MAG: TnpV protein [Faecousia sp.]
MNIHYIRSGDYFIPDLTLPEESRPIGKWGRMHREYLREYQPIRYNSLILSGKLWTYLADLNQQAQDRLERMIDQMKVTEGVTENLKVSDQLILGGTMNNIRNRAEEIILRELIYGEDMA